MSKRRSEAFMAASNHWNKKQKVAETSKEGGDNNTSQTTERGNKKEQVSSKRRSYASPVKLLFNPSYPQDELAKVNRDTVTIEELVGSRDLQETFQFNFSVDLAFFLGYLHPNFIKERRNIVFVTGGRLLDPDSEETAIIKTKFNVAEVTADIPNRFGTHHTKMMVNFYADDSVEVVIMTSNITKLDFGGLTQMMWRSGKLDKGTTKGKKGIQFQADLLAYLRKYDKSRIDTLANRLAEYDFSRVDVDLVASAPGKYNLQNDHETILGYGSLWQALQRNDLLLDNRDTKNTHYNVLAQVSAISYPFSTEKWATAGIFSHLICPMIFSKNQAFQMLAPGKESIREHQREHNYSPSIVFPTVDEVAASNVGFASGGAIHFDYTKSFVHKNYFSQAIKPYLKKWDSSRGEATTKTGREKVMPHVKLYMCDNGDDWNSLKWCYMGSHNLSKQAWGSRKGNKFANSSPDEYEVSSYELGVLITPKENTTLVPSYLADEGKEPDKTFLRMPFALPPANYGASDLPWSLHVSYGDKKDSQGLSYDID
ncbi:uncharacterized protein LODBEIA_P23680 [Lodderomyces beijingensis]|uniref:PLD phosphodiesterase domain-containing protein n=1 Tax=Lodderomyces beijingensis TaxID=1775926 RepID=A0ABP0ZJ29_9ASCO